MGKSKVIQMKKEEDIIASTTINIEQIEEIFGCVNEDNPDNVLDINHCHGRWFRNHDQHNLLGEYTL